MERADASAAPESGRSRPRRGALEYGVVALAFVFHAAFFAWFPAMRSPNELTRVYLASALVEDGTVRIDQQLKRHGPIFDVSERFVDGERRLYSDKAPGVALLTAPVLALYEAAAGEPSVSAKVRLMRLWVSTLPTVLLLFLLLDVLGEYLRAPRLPALLVLAYALGSVATPYASLAYGHQLCAVALFATFAAIRRTSADAPAWRSALVGAGASLAVMVEYQNAVLLLPLGVYFALRVALRPRQLAAAALGAAPLVAVLLTYHQLAWGSPFKTGYSFLASSFKEVHAQGVLGVALPRLAHAVLSFLSPAKGLFFFAPWLALAVPGLWLLWRMPVPDLGRASRHEPRVVVAFVILCGLFVSALVYPVGGWTVSQRHLVSAVPFMLLPAGVAIEALDRRSGLGHVLFVGLALPSLLVCGVSAVVWPHYQEHLLNPFWQLGWPLFRDGFVVPNALEVIGVSSRALACVLIGGAALLLLGALAARARSLLQRVFSMAAPLVLAAAFIALARTPGADQDVRRDRRFIERMHASAREPALAR